MGQRCLRTSHTDGAGKELGGAGHPRSARKEGPGRAGLVASVNEASGSQHPQELQNLPAGGRHWAPMTGPPHLEPGGQVCPGWQQLCPREIQPPALTGCAAGSHGHRMWTQHGGGEGATDHVGFVARQTADGCEGRQSTHRTPWGESQVPGTGQPVREGRAEGLPAVS